MANYVLTHTLTNLTHGNIEFTIVPDAGCTLPSSVIVTNGTLVSYDPTTGIVIVSGDDTTIISAECVSSAKRCIISNLGSQSPADITFIKSGSFPTESEAYEEVTIGEDIFAKFTPWYKRVIYNSNNEVTGIIISDQKEDNDFHVYDCFLDESGNLLPYILIGKYCIAGNNAADSVYNLYPAFFSPMDGRAVCRAKGTGYQMMDAAMQIFWRDMVLACSETINFDIRTDSSVATDLVTYLGLTISAIHRWWWIDGLVQDSGIYLYSNKPSKYVDQPTTSTDGYSTLSYTMPTNGNYIVKALGYDANHPTMNLPSENTGDLLFDTYYCDKMFYSSGNHPCYVGFGATTEASGLFYLVGNTGWSEICHVRLCYKPIS